MTLHADAIKELCASGAQSKGFWPAIRQIANNEGWQAEDLRKGRRPFQPDAFMVDTERHTLTLFEVEHRHLLEDRKLGALAWFWWDLDCEGWHVELVRVNNRGEWAESSLMDEWYRMNYRPEPK